MNDCIFCKIVRGEIDAAKVYEDDDTLSFLDVNPLTKGHCLVIPKKHFENIFDIDKEILQKIISSAKNISEKLKKSLDAPGVNLVNASGKDAEQSVFHFHLHVVPRYENDELHMNDWWQTKAKNKNLEELKKLAEEIINNSNLKSQNAK